MARRVMALASVILRCYNCNVIGDAKSAQTDWPFGLRKRRMPKMPMLQTVATAFCETPAHVVDMLSPLALTPRQFMALKSQALQFMPALFTIQQRMPRSATTLLIACDAGKYVVKVNNRARVTNATAV